MNGVCKSAESDLLKYDALQGSDGATVGETIFTCFCAGKIFQNLLVVFHWTKSGQIYIETSWHCAELNLCASSPPGVWWGHNRESHIFMCL